MRRVAEPARQGRGRQGWTGGSGGREGGPLYYSRGDGVKRDVIVNIFAASALSLKTMAVVQLSRFEPTSEPR